MIKNILILGSSGQIGTHLKEFLINQGYLVDEFDIENSSNEDLRIPNSCEDLIEKSDFVMFLAFDVGGSRYLEKYQKSYEFIDNNVKIMTNTFELLKKYNKPFIFASSQMSNMTYSEYGVLKYLGELYTKTLNGIVVKFWNVYGVEHNLEKSHVITDFIKMAKTDKKIFMRTNGEEERQFLHADDCSECLTILMEKYNVVDRNKELHVTSFTWNKIIDIANIIANNFSATIYPSDKCDNVQLNKRNEPNDYILNFWKPKYDIINGILNIIKRND